MCLRHFVIAAFCATLIGCDAHQPSPASVAETSAVHEAAHDPVHAASMKPTARSAVTQPAEDDFQKAVAENKIIGEQLAKIEASRSAYYVDRAALDASPVGLAAKSAREAIAEAKAAKDPAKISAAEDAAKPALAAYSVKRSALRAAVFSDFTLDQQKKFAGRWLFDASARSVHKFNLTPEQQEKRRQICDQLASAYLTENMMAGDPYLWKLLETQSPLMRDQLRKTVLTPEQAALYDAALAAAATQKSATTSPTK